MILDTLRLALVFVTAIFMTAFAGETRAQLPTTDSAAGQPCDPLIDGTYCATQGGRLSKPSAGSSRVSMAPIQSLADDLSLGQNPPGTLGAISFNGGGTICIGLLRRGSCN